MIDFSKIDTPVKLTKEWVLSRLDEAQIFRYYFGHFELGKVYHSKFRKDSNPSTGFYINKTGNLIYNDLSNGEKLNCFTFVCRLHGLSFLDALKKIAFDFGLLNGEARPNAQKILEETLDFDKEYKKNTLIQFIPGTWTTTRLKYWNDYSIDISDLKRSKVYPVDKLFINKREIYNLDELCFAYIVEEVVRGKVVKTYVKIYSPFSERMKWISNIPITIPFGLSELKYGTEHLVVGKAQKDRLILLKLFESVLGTQNESESALPDDLVRHLKFHFPVRTIIWDADDTGVENCKKFNSKGFGYFNTPKDLLHEDIKDVADYVKTYGLHALEKLLKSKQIL